MAATTRKVRRRSTGLEYLIHSGTVTRQGLEQTLERVREHPDLLETGTSRRTIGRALKSAFKKVAWTQEVQMKEGVAWEWELCDPCKLVRHMLDGSARLQNTFAQCALAHPGPWHIVVAFDEFDTGDSTNHEHERKLMCLSFSFLEFGKERLWSEDYWFTPILVRHDMIKEAVGGWSAMLRVFLNRFLKGPTGISTAGLPLEVDNDIFYIVANVSNLLADGEGHQTALEWGGASSIKPCFRHWNVLKVGTDVASRDPLFVELDCADPGRFKCASTSDLHDIADALFELQARVADGRIVQAKLDKFQKACGFGCLPSGMLADRQLGLDLVNVCTYDWMHTFLQGGMMSMDAALLLEAGHRKLDMGLDLVRDFFQQEWSFPRQHQSKGRRLWQVFQDRRVSEKTIKASASEMLQLYGLLRHFVESQLGEDAEIAAERASFEAACRCMDVMLLAKRGRVDMQEAANMLEIAARDHMEKHVIAYGNGHIKPKNHWVFDIIEQLRRDPFVLDCWVVERLNKRAKAAARNTVNTARYESSVLEVVMAVQRNNLRDKSHVDVGLVGKTEMLQGTNALVAGKLMHHGMHISVGDILLSSLSAAALQVGRVVACCLDSGRSCCIVQVVELIGNWTHHSGLYFLPTDASPQMVWSTEHLELACAWRVVDDALLVVRFIRAVYLLMAQDFFKENAGKDPFKDIPAFSLKRPKVR
jgi:hypothetical protein